MSVEHQPERPAWTCPQCRTPWPCEVKRESLLALAEQVDERTGLRLLMASYFLNAVADQPQTPVMDLYGQIMAWVKE